MDFLTTLLLLIFCFCVAVLVTAFGALVYSGGFSTIEIRAIKSPYSKLQIAYKFGQSAYKNVGPLFDQVCAASRDFENQVYAFGLYYDNPHEVPEHLCRYIVGAVLSDDADGKFSDDVRKPFQDAGFKFSTLPACNDIVTTTFPFKTTLSIYIAVSRVYGKLVQYLKTHKLEGGPVLEFYKGSEIVFVIPLDHQNDFYVAEALAASTTIQSPTENDFDDDDDEMDADQLEKEKWTALASEALKCDDTAKNGKASGGESDSSFEPISATELNGDSDTQ